MKIQPSAVQIMEWKNKWFERPNAQGPDLPEWLVEMATAWALEQAAQICEVEAEKAPIGFGLSAIRSAEAIRSAIRSAIPSPSEKV